MKFAEDIALRSIKRCTGLYIYAGEDGEFFSTLTTVAVKDGNAEVEKSDEADSLEELISKIPPNVPLILSLDGPGVIHRTVEDTQAENPAIRAFPGLKTKDFYIREKISGSRSVIVSLVRRDEIDRLTKSLNEAGLFVFNILLGPFSVDILPDIAAQYEKLTLPFYSLWFENNAIESFHRIPYDPHKGNYMTDIDGERVSSTCLVPLSLCYSFFMNDRDNKEDPLFALQRSEFASKKILSLTLLPFVLSVFIALLVNVVFLSHYEKESRTLEMTMNEGKHQMAVIDSLRKEAAKKQKVLDTKRNNRTGLTAYVSDRIASRVPAGIMLQEMTVNPAASDQRSHNSFQFNENEIVIEGYADSSVSLERFVRNLSLFSWIGSVKILNYLEDKNGARSFTIGITVNTGK